MGSELCLYSSLIDGSESRNVGCISAVVCDLHRLNRSFVRIKLTRKLSNVLNDVDLRPFTAGNVIDLAAPSAEMLIAEGWAERIGEPADIRATADDRGRTTRQRLNDLLANAPRAVKPRK
jgi:hypothetical protein